MSAAIIFALRLKACSIIGAFQIKFSEGKRKVMKYASKNYLLKSYFGIYGQTPQDLRLQVQSPLIPAIFHPR